MRRTLVYQPHNPCTPSLLEDNTQENAKNAANAKKNTYSLVSRTA